jgi:transcriptional regulator with XRE-family HTH domain/Zn-dependent peptidase ImmA (M78 family)
MAVGDRIRLARQFAGISLRELAEKAGLSHTVINKYENNRATPRSGSLIRLADALDLGVEFFLRPSRVKDLQPSFRKQPNLSPDEEVKILGRVQEWLERYLETEAILAGEGLEEAGAFKFPEEFPYLISSLEETTDAARALRDAWGLGSGPIENLTELLEDHGIKVGLIPAHGDFDACALWANGDRRSPVIAARQDQSGDRLRFRLAHDLAELMLKFPPDWGENEVNKAATRFAAAFLAPEEAVRFELGPRRKTISQYELHMLKHKYGVSMQTWIYRATDLGILSSDAANELLEPFLKIDWRTGAEPGERFPIEEPTRLKRMVMRALAEGLIGQRRASELLGEPFEQFSREVAHKHGGLQIAVGGRY